MKIVHSKTIEELKKALKAKTELNLAGMERKYAEEERQLRKDLSLEQAAVMALRKQIAEAHIKEEIQLTQANLAS